MSVDTPSITMRQFTDTAGRLSGQPAFKVLARAQELEKQGRDILHFEIGEPDFDTPTHIRNAAAAALEDGWTHYVNSMGIIELREAICDEFEMSKGFRPDPEQVVVTSGANPIIFYVLANLVGQGGEMIMQDPGFMTYYSVTNYLGIRTKRIQLHEENEFRMNPDDIRAAITPDTRLILMNSPSNPTGGVMTKSEIEEVASIAEEHDIYLLSDEIYGKMTYDLPHNSPSVRDACSERTIVLDGFSKAYAMTGWRLGFCVAPEPVAAKIGLLHQTIDSCTNAFIQMGGVAALKGPQNCVDEMMAEFRKRRDAIVSGLNSVNNISCVMPQGAFYAFPNIKNTGMTSDEFANFALDELGIALLAGTGFGPGGEGYVRLSYARSVETINRAIARMKDVL